MCNYDIEVKDKSNKKSKKNITLLSKVQTQYKQSTNKKFIGIIDLYNFCVASVLLYYKFSYIQLSRALVKWFLAKKPLTGYFFYTKIKKKCMCGEWREHRVICNT